MATSKTARVEACTICRVAEGETQKAWGYVFTYTDGRLLGDIDADDLAGFIKAGRVKKA